MHRYGLVAAWPTWPAYVDGGKRENSIMKDRIIVVSTCRQYPHIDVPHSMAVA